MTSRLVSTCSSKARPPQKFNRIRVPVDNIVTLSGAPHRCVRIYIGLRLRSAVRTGTFNTNFHRGCSHMHCKIYDL